MKYYITLMVIIGVFIIVGGCVDDPKDPESVKSLTTICHPNDFSNGVYYFPCYHADFGNALSAWKRDHPDQIIIAIGVNDRGTYGTTIGYFVLTEPRGKV